MSEFNNTAAPRPPAPRRGFQVPRPASPDRVAPREPSHSPANRWAAELGKFIDQPITVWSAAFPDGMAGICRAIIASPLTVVLMTEKAKFIVADITAIQRSRTYPPTQTSPDVTTHFEQEPHAKGI